MIVVGGTYFERCSFPEWDSLFGSGLRAAAQLSQFEPIILHTPASRFTQRRLPHILGLFQNLEIEVYASAQTFIFDYVHALTPPAVDTLNDGSITPPSNIEVAANHALVYGLMEDIRPNVRAEWVVYDPQSSPHAFRENGSEASHLAVVLNASEVRTWGGSAHIEDCAIHIGTVENAEVVVVKNGPFGALVWDKEQGFSEIPPYETSRFFKIGSGDVFSAIFAYLWAGGKTKAPEAAKIASHATAYYVSTKQFVDDLDTIPSLPTLSLTQTKIRLYLAGPFFTIGERWLVNDVRDIFQRLNIEVISPIHDVGVGLASDIASKDLALLSDSDVVFAIISNGDPGTLFEVGYARRLGKPVIAFYQNMRPSDLTMLAGSGCIIENDLGAAVYRTIWTCMRR